MGSPLLSPGSWCTQGFVCALQESVSPVLCKFYQFYGGINGNFLQEGLCCTRLLHPEPLPLRHFTADLFLHRRHSQFCLISVGSLGPGVHKENALVIANTLFQQHRRRLYTWTLPDGQYRNQIDYILCSKRWRSSTRSAKIRLGVVCGSDHELCIAKFRLKLKKVGNMTRPLRYDLNEIPYYYTVEMINRFKGLDLI